MVVLVALGFIFERHNFWCLILLAIHFYTQIIIDIKNASLLDFYPSPLLQMPHIYNNQGINFQCVELHVFNNYHGKTSPTYANYFYLKTRNNVVHAYTFVHTQMYP